MPKKILKACVSLLLYLAYLALAVLAIVYLVFWLPYIEKIEARNKPSEARPELMNNIGEGTVRKVGFITKERNSAFYNKAFDKPDGVIRVCAFGDSFTYGDEVDNGNDYPAILQQLFVERGYRNVEVINYGNSFHGLGQAYILWDEVGKPMGCDFALLGPQTLFPGRDSYFNHTDDSSPYYLHSLFHFGENNELVRVDVEGETHAERLADYYSFIPRWRYVRYEPKVPTLFRSMIPEGQEVRNPLYYSPLPPDQHVWQLWSRLMEEFSRTESAQVTALIAEEYYYNQFVEHVPRVDNFALDRYIQDGRFPHRAPNRHHSGFGNRVLAERYYAQLTGEKVSSTRVVFADDSRAMQGVVCQRSGPEHNPAQLAALNIQAGKEVIGYLFHASNDAQGTVLGKVDFPALQGRTLIAIADTHEQLGNAAYLFLDRALQGGETMYLQAGDQRRALGRVMKLSASPALYVVRLPGFGMDYYDIASLAKAAYPELESLGERDYSLWLGDTQIYTGRKFQGLYNLDPVDDNQYRFVGHANGYGALQPLAASGTLDLVWQYQAGDGMSEVRCPFLAYRHDSASYQPFAAAKYRIRKSAQGHAIKAAAK